MADLGLVTYCGLYCGLCTSRNRVPAQALALRETMKKDDWEFFGPYQPNFKEFWAFLNELVENKDRCNCRDGKCGPPVCAIRDCAKSRNIEVCAFCESYPCEKLAPLTETYTMLLADGKRMKVQGLDAWIGDQEERKKTGFCYTDVRCKSLSESGK